MIAILTIYEEQPLNFDVLKKQKLISLTIGLLASLPILNFWGYYPNYFSFRLYDYSLPVMILELPEDCESAYVRKSKTGQSYINVEDWLVQKTNVICYPEKDYLKQIEVQGIKSLPEGEFKFIESKSSFYNTIFDH